MNKNFQTFEMTPNLMMFIDGPLHYGCHIVSYFVRVLQTCQLAVRIHILPIQYQQGIFGRRSQVLAKNITTDNSSRHRGEWVQGHFCRFTHTWKFYLEHTINTGNILDTKTVSVNICIWIKLAIKDNIELVVVPKISNKKVRISILHQYYQ